MRDPGNEVANPLSFREAEKNDFYDCEYFGRNKLKRMLWPGTLL